MLTIRGITPLDEIWLIIYICLTSDMIQVNALIPALLAGNSVLLKPSPQTPLTSERIVESLDAVGLPKGLCQVCHRMISQPHGSATDTIP